MSLSIYTKHHSPFALCSLKMLSLFFLLQVACLGGHLLLRETIFIKILFRV